MFSMSRYFACFAHATGRGGKCGGSRWNRVDSSFSSRVANYFRFRVRHVDVRQWVLSDDVASDLCESVVMENVGENVGVMMDSRYQPAIPKVRYSESSLWPPSERSELWRGGGSGASD